jgi:hypothetical protein
MAMTTNKVSDSAVERKKMERLQHVIWEHRHESVADVVVAPEQAIGELVGSAAPFDDVAMVVVKCLK